MSEYAIYEALVEQQWQELVEECANDQGVIERDLPFPEDYDRRQRDFMSIFRDYVEFDVKPLTVYAQPEDLYEPVIIGRNSDDCGSPHKALIQEFNKCIKK